MRKTSMGKFIGRRAKVDPVVPTDETKGDSEEDYEALLSHFADEDYEDYEDGCGGAGPPKGSTDGSSGSATEEVFWSDEEESNLFKAVKSVPAQAEEQTKGGNGEEHDDLYNSESSRSVGELATEQDRDPRIQSKKCSSGTTSFSRR
jgi:hypothetical protein